MRSFAASRADVPASVAAPVSGPPLVRIRTILAIGLLVFLGSWLWNRGRAAWQLHNQATLHADYALCLIGPLGPELLRSNSADFGVLLRRRVITAPFEAKPFSGCEKFSAQMGLTDDAQKLHALNAGGFSEYFDGATNGEVTSPSVSTLVLTTKRLDVLADEAWPFVRDGYLRLVEPSTHTREAAHAVQPPLPAIGSGLPDKRHLYRSTWALGNRIVVALGGAGASQEFVSDDAGVRFAPHRTVSAPDLQDRCAIDAEGRSYTLTSTERERFVLSHGPGAPPEAALLAAKSQKILSISCDEGALVAILTSPGDAASASALSFRACPYRRPCHDLNVPSFGGRGLSHPIDIARIGGDTVLATVHGGITRTTSSRDGGKTWAPWSLAFDRASVAVDPAAAPPYRLLPAGDSLLLYGKASRASEGYLLLASRDHGASFEAPQSR